MFLSLWRRNLIEDGGDKPLDQKSPKGSREREREETWEETDMRLRTVGFSNIKKERVGEEEGQHKS